MDKCAAPFKQCEFDIMYSKGISREGSLLDVATEFGIVRKSGAWYTYEGEQIGQGRENAKTFLSENLEMMIEISEKVRQLVGLGGWAALMLSLIAYIPLVIILLRLTIRALERRALPQLQARLFTEPVPSIACGH